MCGAPVVQGNSLGRSQRAGCWVLGRTGRHPGALPPPFSHLSHIAVVSLPDLEEVKKNYDRTNHDLFEGTDDCYPGRDALRCALCCHVLSPTCPCVRA